MRQEEFAALCDSTFNNLLSLLKVKGGEYSSDADKLSNFKRNAKELGVTPLQVWQIYFAKHKDALYTYIRDDATKQVRPRSEAIEGRIHDMIAYLLLCLALISDKENGE